MLNAEARRHRARLAILTRHHPNSPEVEQARRALKFATAVQYVGELLAADPPLTAEQRVHLAKLLWIGSDGG
jgi:hypothetical protein